MFLIFNQADLCWTVPMTTTDHCNDIDVYMQQHCKFVSVLKKVFGL